MATAGMLTRGDRLKSLGAVALIHLGIVAALLVASGKAPEIVEELPIQLIDIREAPPPEEPPPVIELEPEHAPKEEGEAAPPNMRSQASPVVAPRPRVVIPAPPPVTASPTPAEGAERTQGAAPVPGPGTGAGGVGTGTGAGGSGRGTGGGAGGTGTRPALISRSLTERDYPRELRRRWPAGARVLVIFSVQLDGRATGCRVNRSSGDAAIDAETCRLVETRLRFRPARNERGEPYVSLYAYMQAPIGRWREEPGPPPGPPSQPRPPQQPERPATVVF